MTSLRGVHYKREVIGGTLGEYIRHSECSARSSVSITDMVDAQNIRNRVNSWAQ